MLKADGWPKCGKVYQSNGVLVDIYQIRHIAQDKGANIEEKAS